LSIWAQQFHVAKWAITTRYGKICFDFVDDGLAEVLECNAPGYRFLFNAEAFYYGGKDRPLGLEASLR